MVIGFAVVVAEVDEIDFSVFADVCVPVKPADTLSTVYYILYSLQTKLLSSYMNKNKVQFCCR